jgi:hypothetical protein
MSRRLSGILALLLVTLLPAVAHGHAERWVESPARPGKVPSLARIKHQKPVLDVCKSKMSGRWECRYRDIQAAVNAAPNGALIRIWPGVYEEHPSRRAKEVPPDNPDGTFSYEFHEKHPNAENLIAILGKKNITLLGMGRKPRDVVIDAGFEKHVAIRADRADGIILKNLSVWHAFDHGVYLLDLDGWVIDNVVSGYSREYAFLTFAVDHGLQQYCEATGSGDGGIYPGSAAETPGRVSNEIRYCRSHHNVLGYSGTQGNHVWVHHNQFYDNGVGLVTDSEPDHPNWPQKHLIVENNVFRDNNFNPYAADSDVMATVYSGDGIVPVGTGVLLILGNDNVIQNNQIYGHDRYGAWVANAPGVYFLATEEPRRTPFIPNNNQFIANRMYGPKGDQQNAVDFAWDGIGTNHCWQDNLRTPDGGAATGNLLLPPCYDPVQRYPIPISAGVPDPLNMLEQLMWVKVDGELLCETTGYEPCVAGPGPKPENARNLPEGMRREWPIPPVCGPITCRSVLKR